MTYHQLTEQERYLISALRKAKHRVADIARILQAQERRNGRSRRSRRGPCHEAWQYARVESLLRRQWSPEQIANTLKKQDEFRISFQSIYRHVRRDWRAGGKHSRLFRVATSTVAARHQ